MTITFWWRLGVLAVGGIAIVAAGVLAPPAGGAMAQGAGGSEEHRRLCRSLDDATADAVVSGQRVGDLLTLAQLIHRTNECGPLARTCELLVAGMHHAVTSPGPEMRKTPLVSDIGAQMESFQCDTRELIPTLLKGLEEKRRGR